MKIKTQKNHDALFFELKTDLIKQERIYRICNIFEMDEVFFEIYGIRNSKLDLVCSLLEATKPVIFAQINNAYGLAIKTAVKDMPKVVEVFKDIEFDELNIWDCYISWEKYLKEKNAKMPFFTLNKQQVDGDSKFYLNYNPSEGNKVEIICDLKFDDKNLLCKLTELLLD